MSALSRFAHESLWQVSARSVPSPPTIEGAPVAQVGYEVHWARCEDDVRDAQRLRYQVFSHEMGAHLPGARREDAGGALDVDFFDAHCEHVLVRLPREAGESRGRVVGTYRLLAPGAVDRAGDLYCATEFDLQPLANLRPRMAELGRACVHPDCRSGGVVMALWGAVMRYTLAHGIETLLGSVSVPVRGACGWRGQETEAALGALWTWLASVHLAEPRWQIRPLRAFPVQTWPAHGAQRLRPEVPALIKGYLACNAQVLGPPAFDEDFGTADFPMLLRVEDLPPRYRRRFAGSAKESGNEGGTEIRNENSVEGVDSSA